MSEKGSLHVSVNCPYDLADETRPCWPVDIEKGERQKLLAPQDCNYIDWAGNLDPTELLDGTLLIEVGCEWDWANGEYPRVKLGPVLAEAARARTLEAALREYQEARAAMVAAVQRGEMAPQHVTRQILDAEAHASRLLGKDSP